MDVVFWLAVLVVVVAVMYEIQLRNKQFVTSENVARIRESTAERLVPGERIVTGAAVDVARTRVSASAQNERNKAQKRIFVLTSSSIWFVECRWGGGLALQKKGAWQPAGHGTVTLHEVRETSRSGGRLSGAGRRIEITTNSGELISMLVLSAADSDVEAQVRSELSRVRGGAAATVSPADELSKLAQLVETGILDQNDFERAKAAYLGQPVDARDESIRRLRQLHDLHRSGVLSQSEFNAKKWDILSRN